MSSNVNVKQELPKWDGDQNGYVDYMTSVQNFAQVNGIDWAVIIIADANT